MREGICDKRCQSCVHRTTMLNPPNNVACAYILHTFKKRPCPAGKGCTEYKKGKPIDMRKPVVIRTIVKKCKRCGEDFTANPKQKFCSACYQKNMVERVAANRRKQLEKKKAMEMEKDRVCPCCGGSFHSWRVNAMYCDVCKKLSGGSRASIKKKRGVIENGDRQNKRNLI